MINRSLMEPATPLLQWVGLHLLAMTLMSIPAASLATTRAVPPTPIARLVPASATPTLREFARDSEQGASPQTSYAPGIGCILDVIERVVKIIAICMGGAWAYFNFLKGRVYRPRLESRVDGEIWNRDNEYSVRVSLQLKNVGLGKVDVRQEGTGLRILAYAPQGEEIWHHLETRSVLKNHHWIEPGETVVEEMLVPIGHFCCQVALKLELSVAGAKETTWEVTRILLERDRTNERRPA